MSKGERRPRDAAFKAKVALEAFRDVATGGITIQRSFSRRALA
jgi:hypothetical protein